MFSNIPQLLPDTIAWIFKKFISPIYIPIIHSISKPVKGFLLLLIIYNHRCAIMKKKLEERLAEENRDLQPRQPSDYADEEEQTLLFTGFDDSGSIDLSFGLSNEVQD
jgi:hypothetical protein